MSNYDNRQLRYSCFSEPGLVSGGHPRSLSLSLMTFHRFMTHEIISFCDMSRPYLGYRVQGDQP